MQSPHDTLFGFTFRHAAHAASWLGSIVPPAVAEAIAWQSLQPGHERLPGLWLRRNFADLVFVADLVAPLGRSLGRPPLLILVEHKSHDDPGLHQQLLRYAVSLMRVYQQRHGIVPLILTAVLQHGIAPVPIAVVSEPDPFAAWQPTLPFLVDDLTTGDELALGRRSSTPLATLTLLCLMTLPHTAPDAVPRTFERWHQLMRAVDRADAPPLTPPLGPDAIDTIGWYALAVTDVAPEVLSETFHRLLDRPEDTIMSTLERTYQKGRSEGKAEGEAQGRAETILRQLQKRFGPLPAATIQRVRSGSPKELDGWTDRILEHATIADVLDGPSNG